MENWSWTKQKKGRRRQNKVEKLFGKQLKHHQVINSIYFEQCGEQFKIKTAWLFLRSVNCPHLDTNAKTMATKMKTRSSPGSFCQFRVSNSIVSYCFRHSCCDFFASRSHLIQFECCLARNVDTSTFWFAWKCSRRLRRTANDETFTAVDLHWFIRFKNFFFVAKAKMFWEITRLERLRLYTVFNECRRFVNVGVGGSTFSSRLSLLHALHCWNIVGGKKLRKWLGNKPKIEISNLNSMATATTKKFHALKYIENPQNKH